jgi:hypothetical protein
MRRLAVTGSGKLVPLKGTAYVMIHFTPSATAEATASDRSSVAVSFDWKL